MSRLSTRGPQTAGCKPSKPSEDIDTKLRASYCLPQIFKMTASLGTPPHWWLG